MQGDVCCYVRKSEGEKIFSKRKIVIIVSRHTKYPPIGSKNECGM
jgi:hypothetical protein